jgi:hypothetical protein
VGAHQVAVGRSEQAGLAVLMEPGEDRFRGYEGRFRAPNQLDSSGTVSGLQCGEPATVVHDADAVPLEHDDVDRHIGGEQPASGVEAQVGEVGLDYLEAHLLRIGQDGLLGLAEAPELALPVDPSTGRHEHSPWHADLAREHPHQRRGTRGHSGRRRATADDEGGLEF